jgi:hypothetical protein
MLECDLAAELSQVQGRFEEVTYRGQVVRDIG